MFNSNERIRGYELRKISLEAIEKAEKIDKIKSQISMHEGAPAPVVKEQEKLREKYTRLAEQSGKKMQLRRIFPIAALAYALACALLSLFWEPYFALFCGIALPICNLLLHFGDKAVCKDKTDEVSFTGCLGAIMMLLALPLAISPIALPMTFIESEGTAVIMAVLAYALYWATRLIANAFATSWKKQNANAFEKDPEYQRELAEACQRDQAEADRQRERLLELKAELSQLYVDFADHKPLYNLWKERANRAREWETPFLPSNEYELMRQIINEIPYNVTDSPILLAYEALDKFDKKKNDCKKSYDDCIELLDDIFKK